MLLLTSLLVALDCKTPFSTRDPESPNSNQSSWIQPTSPSYVMTNLRNAIAEKNITNYMRCLADTSLSSKQFRFVAEATGANANPGLFLRWGIEEERNYLNQLILFLPKDSTSQVSLSSLKEDTFPDSAILIQDYRLITKYKCEAGECPKVMSGQAEFRLIRNTEDFWYIHRWSDYATGDEPSWSALKAKFGK